MIQVSIEDILNAAPALEEIGRSSFNGVTAFKIGRLIRELNKEIESFEIVRKQLIEKYCERDQKGKIIVDEKQNVKIKADNIVKYNNEIDSLLKNEIEINTSLIPIECLENVNITPQQAIVLEKFFE